MAKGIYTYEYSDEHGDYTVRKYEGTNIAYKIYDTYDGEKDTPEKAMRRNIEERKAQGKDVSRLEKRLKDTSKVDKADKPEKNPNFDEEKYGKFFDEEGQIKEGQMEAYLDEVAKNEEPKLEYETGFHLMAPVNDFDAAQAYLSSDDMTQYIPDELKDVVKDVKWELEDEESGHISFKTTRPLTHEETIAMSDWIDGQNSDGLGEGFEQQDFAISYYDPISGDGPYTYQEYQDEIARQYDELDPDEYSDYLDAAAVDDAVDLYIRNNYDEDRVKELIEDEYDLTDDDRSSLEEMDIWDMQDNYPDVREIMDEEAREEVLSDPYNYLDDEEVDRAKDEYMQDHGEYDEDDWYNMSSMQTNKTPREKWNEFTITDIEPGTGNIPDDVLKQAEEMQNKLDTAGKPVSREEYEAYQKLANEYNIPDMTNNGGPYIESLKTRSYEDYASDFGWQDKVDNPVAAAKNDLGIEPGSDEEYKLNELYEAAEEEDDTDWSRYDEFLDDLRENKNKGMNYEEWLKEHETKSDILTEAERQGTPLNDEYVTFDNKGNPTLTEKGIKKAMDRNDWLDKYPQAEGETAIEYHDRVVEPYDIAANRGETPKAPKEYNSGTQTTKDKYLNRSEMMNVIDQWSSEGFEEGKYKSDYGKGVFHQKYASGQLEGYGGEEDDFVIRGFDLGSAPEEEALSDLNDKLSKYGYKAEYLKEGTVNQDIKISKDPKAMKREAEETQGKKSTNETMNEKIRNVAAKPKNLKENQTYTIQNRDGKEESVIYLGKDKNGKDKFYNGDIIELDNDTIKGIKESKLGIKLSDEQLRRIQTEEMNLSVKEASQTMNDKIREGAKKTRNKGIKTIAKEYYGEGWNKLSENQKQIWIERNESWLKSAVEAANKKKK